MSGLEILVDRFEKSLKGHRFHQVVYHIQLKSIQGILAVSCGNDDFGGPLQGFQEINSCHLWHFNIQKHQIDGLIAKGIHGFHGVVALLNDFEILKFQDMTANQFSGKRFVIND